MNVKDQLAAVRAEVEAKKAEIARLQRQTRELFEEALPYKAEQRFKAEQLPLLDRLQDPRLATLFSEELTLTVYRWHQYFREEVFSPEVLWPTAAQVIKMFSTDQRYTEEVAAQVLAAELDKPDTNLVFLPPCGDTECTDFLLTLRPEAIRSAELAYDEWVEVKYRYLDGRHAAELNKPNPFRDPNPFKRQK